MRACVGRFVLLHKGYRVGSDRAQRFIWYGCMQLTDGCKKLCLKYFRYFIEWHGHHAAQVCIPLLASSVNTVQRVHGLASCQGRHNLCLLCEVFCRPMVCAQMVKISACLQMLHTRAYACMHTCMHLEVVGLPFACETRLQIVCMQMQGEQYM